MINVGFLTHVLITTAIILDPSVPGDNYTEDKATKTWTTTFSYGTVNGIATCNSTSGTYARAYPEYNFDNNHANSEGVNCWCRMTSPVRSAWVCNGEHGSASACASDCASTCGYLVRNYSTFRGGVFGSAGNSRTTIYNNYINPPHRFAVRPLPRRGIIALRREIKFPSHGGEGPLGGEGDKSVRSAW